MNIDNAKVELLSANIYTASCSFEDCDWQFSTSGDLILSAVRVHMRKHEPIARSTDPIVESRGGVESEHGNARRSSEVELPETS